MWIEKNVQNNTGWHVLEQRGSNQSGANHNTFEYDVEEERIFFRERRTEKEGSKEDAENS